MAKAKPKAGNVATAVIGAAGADSSTEVVHTIYGKTLLEHASALFGGPPRFWGRYFKTPEQQGGTQYNPKTEHSALASAGIRVVPIARQTARIHGSKADGAADAQGNVLAIFAAFGVNYLATQGDEFYVYLDDEGAPQPTLSTDYWLGWSDTLIKYSDQVSSAKVTLLPGLYCNFDHDSWVSLKNALAQGGRCETAWIARWKSDGQVCMPLPPWNQTHVTPDPAPGCPIHIWQYAQECHGGDGFDMDEANPALSLDGLLGKLILPPS
jgi:hypothetical protein